MRKLRLLLSVGTMLGALGGAAYAIEHPPSDGSTPTGPIQSPTGVGIVTTTSGFKEVGSTYTGGQGQQYTPGASSYNLSPFSSPAPGTAITRIDVQFVTWVQGAWWSGANGSSVSGFPGATATNAGIPPATGNKQAPYGIVGYMRLDAGLDGMSKGGIRYGGFTEIRQNTLNPNSTGITTTPTISGGATATGTAVGNLGVNTASATSGGTSAFNTQNTLYVRQMWTYIGTDTTGVIRLGQGFSANSLMQTGLGDEFDGGGWIGWQAGGITPAATGPTWPWADSGNEYQAARIAYLSPVWFGFDTVMSFAPNNVPLTSSGNTCSVVYTGCITQSTSNAAYDIARWRNEFEIGLRYRNTWGLIGLAASGVYTISGATQPGPSAPLGASGTPAGPGNALRFNGLNMGMIGAEVTINKYWAIGANTLFGAYNGSWAMQNKAPYCASVTVCQGSQTQAIAWVAGSRFTFPSVPMTIGGSFFDYKYQGQPGLPTQRTSAGLDLGATYGLGPGAVIIAEYMWGYNYQGGFNFLTNAATGATAGQNNKVSEQIALLGLALRF